MADFTNPEESGLQPQRFKPIRASDVAKVKTNYGISAQPRFGKGTADKEIYKFSAKAVIDWWKKLKAQEAADAAAEATANGAPGTPGAGGGASGGGGGGASTGGGYPGLVAAGGTSARGGATAGPAPAPAPAPAPRLAPLRRTVASESTTAGVTKLAPAPYKPPTRVGGVREY